MNVCIKKGDAQMFLRNTVSSLEYSNMCVLYTIQMPVTHWELRIHFLLRETEKKRQSSRVKYMVYHIDCVDKSIWRACICIK